MYPLCPVVCVSRYPAVRPIGPLIKLSYSAEPPSDETPPELSQKLNIVSEPFTAAAIVFVIFKNPCRPNKRKDRTIRDRYFLMLKKKKNYDF
ncbi:hypothetical protein [Acidianus manzaensis]|uniref:hypothetical protein n=1 Tax=Acidianus manzaensis TaxID=282676 RepID=UPI001C9CB6BA|nr:hypothetical protein [Acidianus manzaensis]